MSTNHRTDARRLAEYDRDMFRSTFVSMFWTAIAERRKRGKFTLQSLAEKLGIDKSAVSRWFSGDEPPNWTVDTIADVAGALDLELKVEAKERATGRVITAVGVQEATHRAAERGLTDTAAPERVGVVRGAQILAEATST